MIYSFDSSIKCTPWISLNDAGLACVRRGLEFKERKLEVEINTKKNRRKPYKLGNIQEYAPRIDA